MFCRIRSIDDFCAVCFGGLFRRFVKIFLIRLFSSSDGEGCTSRRLADSLCQGCGSRIDDHTSLYLQGVSTGFHQFLIFFYKISTGGGAFPGRFDGVCPVCMARVVCVCSGVQLLYLPISSNSISVSPFRPARFIDVFVSPVLRQCPAPRLPAVKMGSYLPLPVTASRLLGSLLPHGFGVL